MGSDFKATIVPADSLDQAFDLAADGSADAAIANHFFGDYFYQKYGLVKTTIVFDPVTLYYATAQGRNHDLLDAIDRHLGEWLQEPKSPYYTTLGRWGAPQPAYRVPQYLIWVIGIGLGLLVIAAGVAFLLRQQVGLGPGSWSRPMRNCERANNDIKPSPGFRRLASFAPIQMARPLM